MTIFDSIILGIVEGITEFLPVSSTAHLILTAKLLGLQETASLKAYETIIQFGAILAVLFIYKDKVFWSKDKTAPNSIKNTLILWIKLAIAFIPTGIAGLFLYSSIKAFFTPSATVWFMIVTGIVFIIVEKIHKEQHHHTDPVRQEARILKKDCLRQVTNAPAHVTKVFRDQGVFYALFHFLPKQTFEVSAGDLLLIYPFAPHFYGSLRTDYLF